jgi:hypothetical protein
MSLNASSASAEDNQSPVISVWVVLLLLLFRIISIIPFTRPLLHS